jgi:F-type H+-transporting ATPase subunit delta
VTERRVAVRYGEALFSLAYEQHLVQAVREELDELVKLVEDAPALQQLLQRPDLETSRKLEALRAGVGAGFSETVMRMLAVLVRHQRGDGLAQVAQAYSELADEAAGVIRAEVQTAVPLSERQRERLAAELERKTGRRVSMEARTDPAVLAGVRVQIGHQLIDGSAAGRLARMREALLDELAEG